MLKTEIHNQVLDAIAEADPSELASILTDGMRRLGQQGRDGAEHLLTALDSGGDDDVQEGLAQFLAVEGVLSGRTDAL